MKSTTDKCDSSSPIQPKLSGHTNSAAEAKSAGEPVVRVRARLATTIDGHALSEGDQITVTAQQYAALAARLIPIE